MAQTFFPGNGGHAGKPDASLLHYLEALQDLGGFQLPESMIGGLRNLQPRCRARRQIFLTDHARHHERLALRNMLNRWLELLDGTGAGVQAVKEHCKMALRETEQLKRENTLRVLEAVRPLETSYRSLQLFFDNAGAGGAVRVVLLDTGGAGMQAMETPAATELQKALAVPELREAYAVVVAPSSAGWKPSAAWAALAYACKVLLLTDSSSIMPPPLARPSHSSLKNIAEERSWSNVIMVANRVLGRPREAAAGEKTDVFLPGSLALAGLLSGAHPAAALSGRRNGALSGAVRVQTDLKKGAVAALTASGFSSLTRSGQHVFMGAVTTLYRGRETHLKSYRLVRLFDCIARSLMDFLNRCGFPNGTEDLPQKIHHFLGQLLEGQKMVRRCRIARLERDAKEKIRLDLHLLLNDPAGNYFLRMSGRKNREGLVLWRTEYTAE